MMAGLPVIASNFPEIMKIVEKEKVGITVDPDSAEEIAAAANRFLEDRAFYTACKENTQKARLKYNWENERKLYLQVFHDLRKR